MRGNSIFRPSLLRQAFNFRSLSSSSSSSSSSSMMDLIHSISTPETDSSIPKKPSPNSTQENVNPSDPYANFRSFSTPSLPGFDSEPEQVPPPSNVVPVKSDEEFNAALNKAEGESVPTVFYFTAAWCAPCRLISPIMDELGRRFPHVITYKLDIDEEGVERTLKQLNITAVPTIHFFKEGKKEIEVVGGDIVRTVQTMKNLYEKKKDD